MQILTLINSLRHVVNEMVDFGRFSQDNLISCSYGYIAGHGKKVYISFSEEASKTTTTFGIEHHLAEILGLAC